MKYLDIHSHLGFEDYGQDKEKVIERMKEMKVGTIAVGADLETSKEAVKVATENENIWACIGQHPIHNIEKNFHLGESFREEDYEELVKNPKVVAIGECGLEYYKLEGDIEWVKRKQKEVFIKQINFALKYNKALMLHIRNGNKKDQAHLPTSDGGQGEIFEENSAFDDVYEILNKIRQEQGLAFFRGNVHFFTGKLEMAQKFIELGFTISFVGLITYVHDFDKIIRNAPLISLQAETDSPYITPVPYRGKRNEPSYVTEVYKKIAEIRGEDPELVRLQLLKNAKRVFSI